MTPITQSPFWIWNEARRAWILPSWRLITIAYLCNNGKRYDSSKDLSYFNFPRYKQSLVSVPKWRLGDKGLSGSAFRNIGQNNICIPSTVWWAFLFSFVFLTLLLIGSFTRIQRFLFDMFCVCLHICMTMAKLTFRDVLSLFLSLPSLFRLFTTSWSASAKYPRIQWTGKTKDDRFQRDLQKNVLFDENNRGY